MQHPKLTILLLVAVPLFGAHGEQFWNGAVSYDLPFQMFTNSQPGGANATEDWEFYVTAMSAGTNGLASVKFHLETLATFIGSEAPVQPLRTALDLEKFFDSKLRTDPRGSYYSTSIIKLDGRDALISTTSTNRIPRGPTTWMCPVCFFWQQNPTWQKSTICAIQMNAEERGTLNMLTNSLKTIKVQPAKLKK